MTSEELLAYLQEHQHSTELDLSKKEISTLPAEIGQLTHLQELHLGLNQLTSLPPEIVQLTKLETLELGDNYLKSLPPELGRLTHLQILDLAGNQLTSLPPELVKLTNLQKLYLSGNQLTSLPPEIGRLIHLQTLNLRFNQLTSLPPEIGRLTNLQTLELWDNQLTSLLPEFGRLANLQQLYLGNNQLTSLPPELGRLTHLQILDLAGNQLTSLPPELVKLTNLQKLYLSGNQLTSLPPELGQLANLQTLSLWDNQLTSLPPELGQLTHLQTLSLDGNQLTSLPPEISNLKQLKALDLRGNPLPIPPEILAKTNDPAAIIAWYLANVLSTAAKRPLNEAKVVLVGQGAVGKTSLVKRLTKDEFNLRETKTEGIGISPWQVRVDGEDINLNIWDFGGQEIMHATHQFFLTKRSLYLLVLNSRQTEAENRVEYWLKLIAGFGGDSPVILVCNQCDAHEMELRWRSLQEKYPHIKHIVRRASCQTREGLLELQQVLEREVNALPHVHDQFAEPWFAVKDELAGMSEDFISFSRYQAICTEHKITAVQDQEVLLGFLHDLGIVLHFADQPLLKFTNVLNPEWITKGVYAIINHDLLTRQHGVLYLEDLKTILDPVNYPEDTHLFLIDIMRKFEMCFDFHHHVNQKFLISVKLPLEPPRLESWPDALWFQYRYEVLPESVITRFIVRMHAYIFAHNYWRHGVKLKSEDGENTALVKADLEDKIITMAVTGRPASRRDLLKLIRADFYKIHASFGELILKEEIPLDAQGKIVVDYQDLLIAERAGDTDYRPSGFFHKIPLRALLDGIEPQEDRRKREMGIDDKRTEIHGDQINIHGTAFGVGREAHVHDIHFQQLWNQVQGNLDLKALAQDLEKLKKQLKEEADTPEQLQAVTDVALAVKEANAANGPKTLEFLKKAGQWAFDTATKIGTTVATEAIKKALWS
jgi:small GTP-binding protein